MSLNSTTVSASITTGESNQFGDVTVANENFTHNTASGSTPITNGTGSGQANHSVEILLTASTGGTTIDLTALTSDGLDGKTRDFSNGGSGGSVKAILIENLDAVNSVVVGQPGSNGWTGFSGVATGFSYTIEPGGYLHIFSPASGKTVGSANKQFTLTASAGTPQIKMSIVGVAA